MADQVLLVHLLPEYERCYKANLHVLAGSVPS